MALKSWNFRVGILELTFSHFILIYFMFFFLFLLNYICGMWLLKIHKLYTVKEFTLSSPILLPLNPRTFPVVITDITLVLVLPNANASLYIILFCMIYFKQMESHHTAIYFFHFVILSKEFSIFVHIDIPNSFRWGL